MKPAGGNPDHGERVPVDIDSDPNDARIRIEMAAPKFIAQDHKGGRVWSMFIARVKEPAMGRFDPQHVKVIPRDFVVPTFVGGVSSAQARDIYLVRQHIAEASIPALKVEVVG